MHNFNLRPEVDGHIENATSPSNYMAQRGEDLDAGGRSSYRENPGRVLKL